MVRAVVPPVAPQTPVVDGGAPHFSAQLGAWVKPLHTDERGRQGFVQRAAKRRRPGNLTLSQRGKLWLAIVAYCAAVWCAGAWVWCSLYGAGQ